MMILETSVVCVCVTGTLPHTKFVLTAVDLEKTYPCF